jgi:hypothetical protein
MKSLPSNQFFVPHNILEESKFISLSISAQMLYIHLCRIKNRMGTDKFYRDMKTLSRETGLHINTLKKSKKELKEAQYIGVERDHYTASGNRSADVFHLNGYRYKT